MSLRRNSDPTRVNPEAQLLRRMDRLWMEARDRGDRELHLTPAQQQDYLDYIGANSTDRRVPGRISYQAAHYRDMQIVVDYDQPTNFTNELNYNGQRVQFGRLGGVTMSDTNDYASTATGVNLMEESRRRPPLTSEGIRELMARMGITNEDDLKEGTFKLFKGKWKL